MFTSHTFPQLTGMDGIVVILVSIVDAVENR